MIIIILNIWNKEEETENKPIIKRTNDNSARLYLYIYKYKQEKKITTNAKYYLFVHWFNDNFNDFCLFVCKVGKEEEKWKNIHTQKLINTLT